MRSALCEDLGVAYPSFFGSTEFQYFITLVSLLIVIVPNSCRCGKVSNLSVPVLVFVIQKTDSTYFLRKWEE